MGRTRTQRSGIFAAALIALTAGAALPAIDAEAQRDHRGDRAHNNDGKRGTICIGNDRGEFWFNRAPTHSLVAYLRECGYTAWIDEGCIYVRYQGRRPRFSIRAPGYSFGVTYGRGCVVISPKCFAPPPRRTVGYRVRDRWDGYDYHPPRRYRGHHGPRFGWNWGHRPHQRWHQPRRCR